MDLQVEQISPIATSSKYKLLELRQISKTYTNGRITFEAVKDVSFEIDDGDFVAIVGPSGSGKTTVLNMIGCIEIPTNGELFIQGKDVRFLSDNELAFIRRKHLGFIFQNFNLLSVLTALENVMYPLYLQDNKISKKEIEKKADEVLEAVGLEQIKNHRPMELSGGQRQRVAIARALISEPKIILADEPTANLDQATGAEVLQLMKRINADKQTTFIISSHDSKVMDIASKIIEMEDGIII